MDDFQETGWRITVCTELHRIEGRSACAGRGQTEIVRVWRTINLLLCSATVLISGTAASLMLATHRIPLVSGGMAMSATLLIALIGVIGPARREGQAAQAARAYVSLETRARQAWQVDLSGQTFDQARMTLAGLTDRWQRVNDLALPVPRWAQRRAEEESFPDIAEEVIVGRTSDVLSVFPVRA
jgi:hypothetical protein